MAIASTLNTTIQLQVDEERRGRVLALYLMLLTLAMPVGSLVQGYLADEIGPRATVAGAGLLYLLVVVVLAAGTDVIPHMDDDVDLDGPGHPAPDAAADQTPSVDRSSAAPTGSSEPSR